MNPFYDLNKRLSGIGAVQKETVTESKAAPKSPVQLSLEQSLGHDLRNLMEDGTGGMAGSNTLEAKDKSLSQAAKTVKKGALHKQEGIPQDKKIGDKKLQSLKKSGTPLEKKRANFALNIQGKGKKSVDESMQGCVECSMGECSEHGQQPMDTNPKHAGWDDRAIAQKKREIARELNRMKLTQPLKHRHPDDLEESEDDILSYLKNKIAPAQSASSSRPYNGKANAADAYNGMYGTGMADMEETANGPHGKPGWLIDAEKNAERRAGQDVDEAMFPGSPEYDAKFGKSTDDFDSAFTRTKSPAGGTIYSRKRKDDDDNDDDTPSVSSDGPRKRGRQPGTKFSGGYAARHAKMDSRKKDMDEEYGNVNELSKDTLKSYAHKAAGDLNFTSHMRGSHLAHGEKDAANTYTKPNVNRQRGIHKAIDRLAKNVDEGSATCPYCGHAMADESREFDMEGVKNGMGSFVKAAKKIGGVASAVKKAKKDYDGDGKIETGPEEHAGSVDKAIKANKAKSSAPKKTEEATAKRDNNAEKAGKKVTKDIEYDEKKKDGITGKKRGLEDQKAEKAGKKVAKDIEYDEKKGKKDKVEETSSESDSTNSSGSSAVGKGIYDSWNRKYENLLKESINITTNSTKGDDGEEEENITIDVSGDDVDRIKELLHNMGVDNGHQDMGAQNHGGYFEVDEAAPAPTGNTLNSKEDIIAFQKANGLTPDGIAGPQTQAKMKEQGITSAAPPVNAGTAAGYKGTAGSQEIQKLNPAIKDVNQIQVGQELVLPNNAGKYTVAAGDTLDAIARGVYKGQKPTANPANAGTVAGQNVSPEQQGRPAPTPAVKSQADKVARFKELLAKARQRPAPNPADAGNGQSPEAQGGPVNPDTAPVTGVLESLGYFLNKMRLMEDLSAEEKTELDNLYKELGNTEQPDAELASLINQYNGLYPSGNSGDNAATQNAASADAADADAGAAMRANAERQNATADDAMAQMPYDDPTRTADDAMAQMPFDQSNSLQNEFGNATQVTKPEEIPTQADKKVPYWIDGKRYEFKRTATDFTPAWRQSNLGFINLQPGEADIAKKLTNQKFTGSQAQAPTSESIQRNSENQRLRELAGIVEAVAPVTQNSPDYPSNQITADTDMITKSLSGGLNGEKSTGQTTIPVVASQLSRQKSDSNNMFNLYKAIKAIESK